MGQLFLIFIENSGHFCKGIKLILTIFELLWGLKINYNKSHLYTSKVDNPKAADWAKIIGCEVVNWPLTYLRANIGCSVKRQNFWLPLIKKVKTKLLKWKCRVLNKSGRSLLIRSTLNSITAYWFYTFRAPKNVLKQLERTKIGFFWNEILDTGTTRMKLHWIVGTR